MCSFYYFPLLLACMCVSPAANKLEYYEVVPEYDLHHIALY